MKKQTDPEIVEKKEETEVSEEATPLLQEVRPGLWRRQTPTAIYEIADRDGVFLVRQTRTADITTQTIGAFGSFEEAKASLGTEV